MKFQATLVGAVAALTLLGTGCATKKFVLAQVNPLEQRISVVERKSGEHTESIDSLENSLSRTNEKLTDVDARAVKANSRAEEAGTQATQAGTAAATAHGAADNARTLAEKGIAKADRLEVTIEASNNLQLAGNLLVLFAPNRAELTAEGRAALDQLATTMKARKRYACEVQGYTDKTGSPAYNLQLSRQRAENVARYLNSAHQVPLRNIHLIGSGSESPVASNTSRAGRKMNRRVEVRLFVPESEVPKQALAATTQ